MWRLLVTLLPLLTLVPTLAGAEPLDAWREGRPMVICAQKDTEADWAVADWIVRLWAPNERRIWLGCISPDLTVIQTDTQATAWWCGGNPWGCYYFTEHIAFGTGRAILAHEIGHAFGLEHTNKCEPSIMTYSNCGLQITEQDVEGVIDNIGTNR